MSVDNSAGWVTDSDAVRVPGQLAVITATTYDLDGHATTTQTRQNDSINLTLNPGSDDQGATAFVRATKHPLLAITSTAYDDD